LNQSSAFRNVASMKHTYLILFVGLGLACNDSTDTPGGGDVGVSGDAMSGPNITDIFVVQTEPVDGGVMDGAVAAPSVCIEPPTITDVPVRLETVCRSGKPR
jgi:hypothetical protein